MKNVCIRFVAVVHILVYQLIANSCYSNSITSVTNSIDFGSQPSFVPVGIVLDADSPLGSMLNDCVQFSVSDIYLKNPNFTTFLHLHSRNAQSVLDSNFAVEDLLKHEQVKCIIGPQGSTEDVYFSELGQRFNVPMISTTARSSSPSTAAAALNSFSLMVSMDDVIQSRALAALCQEFQWPQAVLLYEDTDYGYRFQSHLTDSFRAVGIGLVHHTAIPFSADRKHLVKLLAPLNEQETRVFIVHANPSLGFRLFKAAKKAGMMREGTAWIITDSFSNFLSSMDSSAHDSMEGVLAVRPYVPPSKELRYFHERFERNSSRASMDLNIYGLWAYDAITALAVAAESLGPPPPDSSSYGSRLLRELSNTRFRGLSGNFELVDGRLKPSDFEIVNLIGTGERRVGLWNPHRGISRDMSLRYYGLTRELKNVVWPGDAMVIPKGWDIPTSGHLRVGVPWKPFFTEFVDVAVDPATNETLASGFAVDIFRYALKQIPFPINHTFFIYNESTSTNWSYDSMLHEIPEKYDMVVADTTIWAPRASYVDFSLPYSDSGLVFVVKNKRPLDIWIFTKPLSGHLWLAILVSSIIMGVVVWMLEAPTRRARARALANAREHARAQGLNIRDEDEREIITFLVPLAALAFPDAALVGRRTSLFLLGCWLFCAFILMQSYTANLSAMLTLSHLEFAFSGDHYIGYHNGSFTREFLTEKLHMSPTRLRAYLSCQQYHEAMRKGGKGGGVDAIFDEVPYMKLFLHQYPNRYGTAGPTYRTGGLGFAFGIGSPLVAYFSRAMLNVTQGPEMVALEKKHFGPGYSSEDPLHNELAEGVSGLTLHDFAGLFIILGGLTGLAIVVAIIVYIYRNARNGQDNVVPAATSSAAGNARNDQDDVGVGEGNARNDQDDVGVGEGNARNDRANDPPPPPPPADGERNDVGVGEGDDRNNRANDPPPPDAGERNDVNVEETDGGERGGHEQDGDVDHHQQP